MKKKSTFAAEVRKQFTYDKQRKVDSCSKDILYILEQHNTLGSLIEKLQVLEKDFGTTSQVIFNYDRYDDSYPALYLQKNTLEPDIDYEKRMVELDKHIEDQIEKGYEKYKEDFIKNEQKELEKFRALEAKLKKNGLLK